MKPEDIYHLSLAAVLCGLLGTVILAFALSRWMAAVSLSLTALDAYKDTGGRLNFTGTDKHRSGGVKWSQYLTYGGLILIILASALQVIALYFSANPNGTVNKASDHTRANKTDAGNGSKVICRVSNVLLSPSPDPSRSP